MPRGRRENRQKAWGRTTAADLDRAEDVRLQNSADADRRRIAIRLKPKQLGTQARSVLELAKAMLAVRWWAVPGSASYCECYPSSAKVEVDSGIDTQPCLQSVQ